MTQGRPGRVKVQARWENPDCTHIQISVKTRGKHGRRRVCVLPRKRVVPFGQSIRCRGNAEEGIITVRKGLASIGGIHLSKQTAHDLLVSLARLLQQAPTMASLEREVYEEFFAGYPAAHVASALNWHDEHNLFSHQEKGEY